MAHKQDLERAYQQKYKDLCGRYAGQKSKNNHRIANLEEAFTILHKF